MGKVYKLWGLDTFANESYSCGEFLTLKEAEKALRRAEARVAESQDPELRDTFSIEETTDEYEREMEEMRSRYQERKLEEQEYSRKSLLEAMCVLVTRLRSSFETVTPEELRSSEALDTIREVTYKDDSAGNCYDCIALLLYLSEDENLSVSMRMEFPAHRYNDEGKITRVGIVSLPVAEFREWLYSRDTIAMLFDVAKDLVKRFYKD